MVVKYAQLMIAVGHASIDLVERLLSLLLPSFKCQLTSGLDQPSYCYICLCCVLGCRAGDDCHPIKVAERGQFCVARYEVPKDLQT